MKKIIILILIFIIPIALFSTMAYQKTHDKYIYVDYKQGQVLPGGYLAPYDVHAIQKVKRIANKKEIIVPNDVNIILSEAFACLKIEKISMNNTKIIYPEAFKECDLLYLDLSNVEYIGRLAFWNNKLKELTIPETVKYIGEGAFISNSDLKEVYIFGNPLIEGPIFDKREIIIYGNDDIIKEYCSKYNYIYINYE